MLHLCGYCSTVRSNVAKARGLTEEKIAETKNFETSELFTERERAALRFAGLFKSGADAIDSDEVYDAHLLGDGINIVPPPCEIFRILTSFLSGRGFQMSVK
jgi:alkylhydroperoxidase family enzyme